MIQKLRKVFALAASAALVLGLAACSGAEKPRTSTESSAETVEPPPVPGPAVPPGGSGEKSPNSDLSEQRPRLPKGGGPTLIGKDKDDYFKIFELADKESKAVAKSNESPAEKRKMFDEVEKRQNTRFREACRTGNNFVCDQKVSTAVVGSEEWTFYATCGGRSPSPVAGKCQTMTVK